MAWSQSSQASDITKYAAGTVASDAVTLTTVNAGDFIYVWVTCDSASIPTITVSDPTNGTYTSKLSVDHSGDQMAQQFYMKNAAAGSNLVVTAAFSVNRPFVAMYAAAWSGADTAAGFDIEDGQVQTSVTSGTDVVRTTATATNAADLIIATSWGTWASGPAYVAGTGPPAFSEDTNLSTSAFSRVEVEHYTQAGAASAEGYWTISANITTALSLMMAVKPATGNQNTIAWITA